MERDYFKSILDNTLESVVLIGKDHRVLAFNKKNEEILKSFQNKDIQVGDLYFPEYVLPENKELYLKAFDSSINGTPYSIKRIAVKDSIKQWFEFKMVPFYIDSNVEGVILFAEDITAEKETEIKTIEMAKIYKAILESAEESIMLLDKNYKMLAFNKLFESRAYENSKRHAQIGDDFREYINDESFEFYEFYQKALNGENNLVEIPYNRSENEIIWYQTKFTAVHSENNDLIGVSIIAKDITKEKNIELLLIENEKKLKILVENNPIAKFIIQNNNMIYANPVFETIFKYPHSKFLKNYTFEELIHPDDVKIYQQAIKKNTKNKKTTESVLLRTFDAKGKLVFVEFFANIIVYNNEPAIVGSVVNITQRIQEENRINLAILETQEKERLQIGMELHDNVKQILSGISIYLDVALKKIEDKEAVISLLNKLKKYNNDAVSELRKLSHQLAPLVEDDSSLKDKIDWLIQSLKLRDTLSISIEVDEFKFKLNDTIQLHFYRILQELLSNIVKYSKANKVCININRTKDFILFNVKDNGIGFDVNVKKQGIGLENIRRRVKILNGELKIVTEIGKGVEISIMVPYS